MSEYAIGILTFNRPDSFLRCVDGVIEFSKEDVELFVVDNGSTTDYDHRVNSYDLTVSDKSNIAHGKNILLSKMMESDADFFFIVEDDMIAKSSDAFNSYIDAYHSSGIHHFMFAHHGDRNKFVETTDGISLYYECVGSWCFYTRESIDSVGLMDENFDNCWEHVVHSLMLSEAGFMGDYGWRKWPDVEGSNNYITDTQVVSSNGDISDKELMSLDRIQNGLKYWKSNYTFPSDIEELII